MENVNNIIEEAMVKSKSIIERISPIIDEIVLVQLKQRQITGIATSEAMEALENIKQAHYDALISELNK